MAKIGTKTVVIKGQCCKLDVFYTQKEGFSYKGLPEEFVSMMNWGTRNDYCVEGWFSSESKMETALTLALKDYHERIAKTRKVLYIELEGSMESVMNKGTNGAYSGWKEGVSKYFSTITNAPKYCFGFSYKVLHEIVGKKTAYHYILKDGGVGAELLSSHNNKLVIDWTKEREDFLENLGSNVQNLIYQVSAFFDNPDSLALMDGGKLLLAEETKTSMDDEEEDAIGVIEIGDVVVLVGQRIGEVIGKPSSALYEVRLLDVGVKNAGFYSVGEEITVHSANVLKTNKSIRNAENK